MDYPKRIARLLENLIDKNAACFLTENPLDIRYFTGCVDKRGLLIIRVDGANSLVVPQAAAEEARATSHEVEVYSTPLGKSLFDELPAILPPKGKLLLGKISTRATDFLGKKHKKLDFEVFPEISLSLQREKSDQEIEFIKCAMTIAERGVIAAFRALRAGATELEVAAEATREMMYSGAEDMWFPAHVVGGLRSVFPDAGPSKRKLLRGEMGFVDVGPIYSGYAGDLTRSFVLGNPSADQLELLKLSEEAQRLALDSVSAGVSVSNLYYVAFKWLEEQGMKKYFPHPLGHGLGLLGACPPWIKPNSDDVLLPGDIITIEPGLYVPGIGGCRIEDIVIVKEKGYEPISTLSLSWEVADL